MERGKIVVGTGDLFCHFHAPSVRNLPSILLFFGKKRGEPLFPSRLLLFLLFFPYGCTKHAMGGKGEMAISDSAIYGKGTKARTS